MATYTSNYAWTKPSGNDNVDISVLNANLDSQDSIMHDAFANMAQAFSESSTYEVGDIVVYGTTTYKCHTAVTTAGSWTGSTNWQVYKLSEGGSGGGGTSNYNDLTNKPSINGVTLSGNKTASDLSLQDKMQYSTMPTASADNEGKIYQYVGTTDSNYTNGYYYKCVENSGSYSWQLVENINDQTPTFTEASTRNNIASGEKLSVIMGKIAKFFNDLKTVAFSGNASDLNYDNTTSGLSATKTQGAIDELADEKANEPTEVTWAQWIQKTPQEQETGDWRITDCPWADGDVSVDLMTKLWENPSPTASFAAQNVTLASDDYDYLLAIGYLSTGSLRTVSAIMKKGSHGFMSSMLQSVAYSRNINRTSDTELAVQGGYNGTTADNSVMIPYIIYGIKLIASVKINAIAMDVSTSADKCMLNDNRSVEDLTKHDYSSYTGITSYTSASNPYIVPSDGYVRTTSCSLKIGDSSANVTLSRSSVDVASTFVRKGTKIFISDTTTESVAIFIPLQ